MSENRKYTYPIITLDGLLVSRLQTHEYRQIKKPPSFLSPIYIRCGSMDDMPCLLKYCVTGIVERLL